MFHNVSSNERTLRSNAQILVASTHQHRRRQLRTDPTSLVVTGHDRVSGDQHIAVHLIQRSDSHAVNRGFKALLGTIVDYLGHRATCHLVAYLALFTRSLTEELGVNALPIPFPRRRK